MNNYRKTAVIVGILFIIGTVTGILSVVFTGPIVAASDFLAQTAANNNQVTLGALLMLAMGLSLAMVPVFMYPIFKGYNKNLALGYLVFRSALEAATYIGMTVSWILLIALSNEYAAAGMPDSAHYQTLGRLLLGASDHIHQVTVLVFGIGALMFYTLWYQSRLVPRWLSVWGLIGTVLYLAAGLMSLFGQPAEILLAVLGLNEMVLALWLIFKGFKLPTVD